FKDEPTDFSPLVTIATVVLPQVLNLIVPGAGVAVTAAIQGARLTSKIARGKKVTADDVASIGATVATNLPEAKSLLGDSILGGAAKDLQSAASELKGIDKAATTAASQVLGLGSKL